jgi:hypothetical protein
MADAVFAHTTVHGKLNALRFRVLFYPDNYKSTIGESAKLYKCQSCDQSFVFKTQLVNHSYSHVIQTVNRTVEHHASHLAQIPPPPPTVSIHNGQIDNIKAEKYDHVSECAERPQTQKTFVNPTTVQIKEEYHYNNEPTPFVHDDVVLASNQTTNTQHGDSHYSISNSCSLATVESSRSLQTTDQQQSIVFEPVIISPQAYVRKRSLCKDLSEKS